MKHDGFIAIDCSGHHYRSRNNLRLQRVPGFGGTGQRADNAVRGVSFGSLLLQLLKYSSSVIDKSYS